MEKRSDEQLEPFRNKIAVQLARKFVWFKLRDNGEGEEVKGSIVQLVRVDAWTAIVMTSLTEQKCAGTVAEAVH